MLLTEGTLSVLKSFGTLQRPMGILSKNGFVAFGVITQCRCVVSSNIAGSNTIYAYLLAHSLAKAITSLATPDIGV